MFEKYNKKVSTIKEGIDLQLLPFKPLKEMVGQTIKVDGFFFTKGRYGEQLVVVGNGVKVNMPARAVEQFKGIATDTDAIKYMLEGHMAITDIKPVKTNNGNTTGYQLADC